MVVVLAVTVSIVVCIRWSNIFHLVHASALRAALNRSVARGRQPDNDVGVRWVTCAAEVLLVTEGLDHDWVVECSFSTGVQWSHVEHVNSLHLSENLESLKTGGLFEVGGNGTGLTSRWEKVLFALDLVKLLHVLG